MARSLLTMRTELGRLVQDTSGVSQGVLDTTRNDLINKANRWWHANMEYRAKEVTLVTSYGGSAKEILSDAGANHPEILAVYISSATRPLLRLEWNELRELQFQEVTESATPTHYAAYKAQGSSNRWRVGLWRIPSGALAVQALVRLDPTALVDDVDVPDLNGFEADCVVYIAAYWAAMLMNRPKLAQAMLHFLPQMVQDKLTSRTQEVSLQDPTGSRLAVGSPL